MSEQITSGQAFSDAIRDVVARYLLHFEPTADPELYKVHLDATGPELNILYDRQHGQTPTITFTMHAAQDQAEAAQQGERNKRGGLFS